MLSRQPTEKQAWTEERRFFESDGRPLYGVTYRAERPAATLVIFCNSFSENHCEGRAEAIAARIIAANGYSSLPVSSAGAWRFGRRLSRT